MKTYLIPALLSSAIVASGSVTAAGMGDSNDPVRTPMEHDQGMMPHEIDKSTATPGFTTLDADADGYLSRTEVSAQDKIDAQWDTLDKNNDRRLDRAEFSAFETEGPKLDADSNDSAPLVAE